MKVGILTHHTVINQGAILQMYATTKWLQERGIDVCTLSYIKNFDFDLETSAKYNISLKNYPYYFREYLLKKGIGLTIFNIKKQILYKKYIKETFKFENYALNYQDAVIVGSDEVFSLEYGCNSMMYGHGVNTDKLISYAPSFGQTDIVRIEKYHYKELLKSGLEKFSYLSVRDKKSAETVEKLIGQIPEIVCDPVLLYDFKKVKTDIKKIKQKYLLVYAYDKNMTDKNEVEAIIKYAKEKGLITVSAGTYHKWCDLNIVCDPLEWIEYFRNAEEIITDTFHGAILSIITNKNSFYYIRNINTNKLSNLLKQFYLENKILKEISYKELKRVEKEKQNFEEINKKLKEIRKSSEEFLIKALGI